MIIERNEMENMKENWSTDGQIIRRHKGNSNLFNKTEYSILQLQNPNFLG